MTAPVSTARTLQASNSSSPVLNKVSRKEDRGAVDYRKSVAIAKNHTVLNDTVSASMLVLDAEKGANVKAARTRFSAKRKNHRNRKRHPKRRKWRICQCSFRRLEDTGVLRIYSVFTTDGAYSLCFIIYAKQNRIVQEKVCSR